MVWGGRLLWRSRPPQPTVNLAVRYAQPLSKGATGQENGAPRSSYCLSYTATLVTFLPAASVMSVVSVRVL
jgi:hypothetical protein